MAEIKRKLASIRRIKKLLPIEGADKIELALVDGWQVVVKKGEFTEGQLAVYFEIDSWVPTNVAPFLTKDGYEPKEYNGVKGERLKTIKLRKQLSQGLLLPVKGLEGLKNIGTGAGDRYRPDELEEGTDVTEALGVLKWEVAEKETNNVATGSKTRSFPFFLRKTDQERAQNYGRLIEANLDTQFEVTVKKDGSSLTVFRVDPSSPYYKDAKKQVEGKLSLWERIKRLVLRKKDEPVFGICSRNQQLPLEGNSNFHLGAAIPLAALRIMNGSYAIQGELVAPDIQGNYENVKSVEFHMFDLWNIDKQEYVLPEDRRDVADSYLIPHATVVDKGTLRSILQLQEGEDPVAKLLVYASGEGDNAGVMREGVVFKAMDKDFSFKVISNEYLLKKKD